jgi:hypothetical protein
VVTLFALLLAAHAYHSFLKVSRQLFDRLPHDRNAHYDFGVNLALDVLHHDWGHLLHDLDGARVWGVLHGVLLGFVQIIGGIDYRLGVLPSLAGWVLTALFGFLLARRVAPVGGKLAGLFAALFIMASPAHHAFATDIMLESLGACLSLLVLYCYVVTVQAPDRKGGIWLGLSLSLLLLLKSNYWTLVMITLVVAEGARRPQMYLEIIKDVGRRVCCRAWLLAEAKNPLNYLLALLVGLSVFVAASGGGSFSLGKVRVSFRAAHTLINLAFAIVVVRGLWWWFRGGKSSVSALGTPAWQFACFHVFPVALWFLLPKRLGYFLWYLSPAHGQVYEQSWSEGVAAYWAWLVTDYHAAFWCAILALVLVGIAGLRVRNLRAGSGIIFWFLIMSALLVSCHPIRLSRCLHSWVAILWVGAGVGLSQCCFGIWDKSWPKVRTCLGGAVLAGLGMLMVPGILQVRAVDDGGPQLGLPSNLDLTDSYLPYLADSRKTLILCNHVPMKQIAEWTYLERYGNQRGIEIDIKGYGANYLDNREAFDTWLQTTTCDTLVYIDIPPNSPFSFDFEHLDYSLVGTLLAEQKVFTMVRKIDLSHCGCTVYLWKRTN